MTPTDIIDEALEQYPSRYVIAMFSGGHDSLVATHVATQHPKFSFVLHLNTGIGIEQTRGFVRQTCKEWGVELREYKATEHTQADGTPDPQIYEDMVLKYGFPTPGAHSVMYAALKQKSLLRCIRDVDRNYGEKVVLVTGARKQESHRRMRHVKKVTVDGSRIWVAPIWDFDKLDVNNYIKEHGLKRNPTVDLIHMSGECLCGAFAVPGEKEELRLWFPNVAEYLDELECRVKAAGFPWGWEEQIPDWWKRIQDGQMVLTGLEHTLSENILCRSCQRRNG